MVLPLPKEWPAGEEEPLSPIPRAGAVAPTLAKVPPPLLAAHPVNHPLQPLDARVNVVDAPQLRGSAGFHDLQPPVNGLYPADQRLGPVVERVEHPSHPCVERVELPGNPLDLEEISVVHVCCRHESAG